MTNIDDRDQLEERMVRFALGEMDDADRADFERLLTIKPEIADEVEALRRTMALLPYAAMEAPPRHLRARVLSHVRHPAAPISPLRRPGTWGWLLAAAASIAAAVLLGQNLRLAGDLALQRDVARLLQEPNVTMSFALRGETDTRSVGRVVLDLDGKKGAAVMLNLTPLVGDQVYRLWAIVAGKPVWCGNFEPGDDLTVRRQFPIPVDAYTAPISRLILTLEPGPDLPAPVGPTVMTGT